MVCSNCTQSRRAESCRRKPAKAMLFIEHRLSFSVVLRRALVRRCIELSPSTAHRRADSLSEFFGMSSHGLLKLSSSTWELHGGCARQSCAVMRPPGRAPFLFLVSGCALNFVINQWPTSPLHGWTACNETLDLLGNHMLFRLN